MLGHRHTSVHRFLLPLCDSSGGGSPPPDESRSATSLPVGPVCSRPRFQVFYIADDGQTVTTLYLHLGAALFEILQVPSLRMLYINV